MSYEDIQCPICKRIGLNFVEEYAVSRTEEDERWVVCKCGHDIMPVEEE